MFGLLNHGSLRIDGCPGGLDLILCVVYLGAKALDFFLHRLLLKELLLELVCSELGWVLRVSGRYSCNHVILLLLTLATHFVHLSLPHLQISNLDQAIMQFLQVDILCCLLLYPLLIPRLHDATKSLRVIKVVLVDNGS